MFDWIYKSFAIAETEVEDQYTVNIVQIIKW